MRKLLTALLLIVTISCSKSNKEDDSQLMICTGPTWLLEKYKSLAPCVCETVIFTGTYNGKTVIEQRLVDPVCNGFDIVYNVDNGSVLFTSQNVGEFKKYKDGVTGLREIWRCSKTTTTTGTN